MIEPGFVRTMATYNAVMNATLYAAAARLTDEARRADRGAFWGSIHGTLSHLVWADQILMSRFDGWDAPNVTLANSARYVPDFTVMRARRTTIDARLQTWADDLDPAWLDGEQQWFSAAIQRDVRRPRALLVAHLFNHQTHHRGQVHAMLTAAGEHTGDTDLWLMR